MTPPPLSQKLSRPNQLVAEHPLPLGERLPPRPHHPLGPITQALLEMAHIAQDLLRQTESGASE